MLTDSTLQNSFDIHESTIGDIRELAESRAIYNKHILKFLLTTKRDEIELFFKDINILSNIELANLSKVNPENFDKIKKIFYKTIQDDMFFYITIIKLIDDNPHNHILVDRLHYTFTQEYEIERTLDNTSREVGIKNSSKKSNPNLNRFLETHFFRDALVKLDPIISKSERKFCDEMEFLKIAGSKEGEFLNVFRTKNPKTKGLVTKCKTIIFSILTLINDAEERFKEKWNLSGFVEIDQLNKNIMTFKSHHEKLTSEGAKENFWEVYREIHEIYSDLQETKRRIDGYIQILADEKIASEKTRGLAAATDKQQTVLSKKLPPKKASKQSEGSKITATPEGVPTADKTIAAITDPSSVSSSSLEDHNFPTQKESVDVYKLRVQSYKEQIASQRAEKQRLAETEKREEQQCPTGEKV